MGGKVEGDEKRGGKRGNDVRVMRRQEERRWKRR